VRRRGSLLAVRFSNVKEQLRASAKKLNDVFARAQGVFTYKINHPNQVNTSSHHNTGLANHNCVRTGTLTRSRSLSDFEVREQGGTSIHTHVASNSLSRSHSFSTLEVREQERLSIHYHSTDNNQDFEEPVAKHKDLEKYLGPMSIQDTAGETASFSY
jgi:hypothetical protein